MRIAAIIVCLFSMLMLPLLPLFAQVNQLRFSRIDIAQGLSNNEVNCIYKDEKGFIWFGTRSGLNRFDGYRFKVFKHDQRDTSSISDEEVNQIFEGPGHTLWIITKSDLVTYNLLTEKFDRHPQRFLASAGIPDQSIISVKKGADGGYWFLGATTGLYKYNPATGKAACFFKNVAAGSPAAEQVSDFAISNKGYVWVAYNNGLLKKIDAIAGKIITVTTVLQQQAQNQVSNYQLYLDAEQDIWIYAPGASQGVYFYEHNTGSLTHITKGNTPQSLNNNVVRVVCQDNDGLIWLATDHGGINLLNKKDFTTRYLLNHEDDEYSISQNSINSMLIDNTGIIWVGTYKRGICYYHNGITKFPLYRHKLSDPNSLPYNDVNRFVEDAKGNIWIGTNGGGLTYFERKTGKFTRYVHNPADPNSLSNDVVVSLCIDHNQSLWIGTYFGGLDKFDGKNFTHYKHNNNVPSSLSDNAIWSVMEDSQRRLWVGTFSAGLDRLDPGSDTFIHFKPTGYHSVHSAYVCDLVQAKNGDIWIATSNGVDVVEGETGIFSHYFHHDEKQPVTSLSNNNTISLLEDSRHLIWIATREGLNYYDPSKGTFATLRKENGLADNIILSLVEDSLHNLWVGTPSGLSNIIINKDRQTGELAFQYKNYDESDGLQGKEFNEYAALATKDGALLFGGGNGFNLFSPSAVNNSEFNPQLVLTDLQMFNKSVSVGEKLNGHVILPASISTIKQVTLKYNENIFSIEFAALNFFNTSRLRYAYTLEGFNNQWFVADDNTHKATYTNLDAGDYTFRVTTIDENGNRSKYSVALVIKILPPLWRTPAAYILYALLITGLLYFARRMVLQRARMRFSIEQERTEAQRLHALDMMKIRFFTNLSHEFRTPLSLIITPLDKIIKEAEEPGKKNQFQMIYRNARRLLNLVNQLLDFRKMEMQELKLCPAKSDLVKFVREVSNSFTDLAAKNHINFTFTSTAEHFVTQFDHDKIERILFNLLSNAFKFTTGSGNVTVNVAVTKQQADSIFEIRVCDTGIGIPTEKQEKIFERFFQNTLPANLVNQGSGIGLAISREFVKLHNGTINVESEVNKGSCFTVLLPLKELAEDWAEPNAILDYKSQLPVAANLADELAGTGQPGDKNKHLQKPGILLVEDNDDLRFYLKDNLKEHFTIVEAINGKLGWQKALANHPDIIISDISMPEMDGIELCHKIKHDKRTSHIPVILLTALAGEEKQIKGLETGANDYVTKPFNFEILLSKIRNLLSLQDISRRTYQKQFKANPTDVKVESADERFMQELLQIVEKNIANADFLVEDMSRELHISRVGLYKKMMALTGKTPLEFVRVLRMERAAQLLEKSKLTIAEVAYEVGFNDPKYFSKFFKAHFNILPSAYQSARQKQAPNPETAPQE